MELGITLLTMWKLKPLCLRNSNTKEKPKQPMFLGNLTKEALTCRSSLVAQWVKDLAPSMQWLGSLLWLRFHLWLRSFHTLRVGQQNKTKQTTKNQKKRKKEIGLKCPLVKPLWNPWH